jgi:hypothetical protein
MALSGRQLCDIRRETVSTFQLVTADLVNPAKYETERERD